jgi:hypothetical protein
MGGVRILHTKNAIFILEVMHRDTVPTEKTKCQHNICMYVILVLPVSFILSLELPSIVSVRY